MGDTALHPLDFGALEKGSWLETEELERATMLKRTDKSFWSAVLRLRDEIKRQACILTRTEGSGADIRLRLMTDSEATAWAAGEGVRAIRKLNRSALDLMTYVDRSNLTDPELRAHEHASRVLTAVADAAAREKKKHARLLEFLHAPQLGPGEDEDD